MSSNILDDLYKKANDLNTGNRADLFYYIIQIKSLNPEFSNHIQSLYIDIKSFIENYIISINKRDFGYDVINIRKINSAIDTISLSNQKLSLFLHAYKILKNNHFEDDAEAAIVFIRKTKLQVLKEKKTKWKWVGVLCHLISYSIIAVLCILFVLFVISYVIYLPALNNNFAIINFQYEDFHKNFYVNHFFNIIYYLFDISDKVQINPINWGGVLLISVMKLFYFVCIANYLYQIILERLKLNK